MGVRPANALTQQTNPQTSLRAPTATAPVTPDARPDCYATTWFLPLHLPS